MKRLLLVGLLVLGVATLCHHRRERERTDAQYQYTWTWPEQPLSPRPPELPKPAKRSHGPRLAGRGTSVRVTTSTKSQPRVDLASNEKASEDASLPSVVSPKSSMRVISSEQKADEDRALCDLQMQINRRVSEWLAESGVPLDWSAPKSMTRSMMQSEPTLTPVVNPTLASIGASIETLYLASAAVDFSAARKSALIREYHRHVSAQRLGMIGGVLAFVLACLGITVGYVRTDEATKGYYTNRLKLLAAASVGASGVLLYQWITRGV